MNNVSELPTKELIEILSKRTPKWAYNHKEFIPGTTPLYYSGPFFDEDEIKMALTAFLEGNWLVTGEYVHRFQNVFAAKFKVKHAHMVNSGSSANLVLITALKKHFRWLDGDEIIVSPVGFPTTIAPIVQNNLKPVFADIEMDTLNFNIREVERKINLGRTVAIFVSPVLGNPPDMDQLKKLCDKHNIKLIGDNCDSLGSKWDQNYLNTYYAGWTTSFYPAHHISTGEGGMVCSDDEGLITTARSISWWGRDCRCVGKANLSACGTCGNRFSKWLENEGVDVVMDHKYLFTTMGYNLKPLDLQGAIGLAQLRKIDEIERRRRENAKAITDIIENCQTATENRYSVAKTLPKADPCWFGVPIICPSNEARQRLVDHFESHKIQTRSYFAGNILAHPGYSHLDNKDLYPNANLALSNVFFLGCPPHYRTEQLNYIRKVFQEFCGE
jgi:CDP-6-deoxy-D-xylo-4-hexulose-3-dehydrase